MHFIMGVGLATHGRLVRPIDLAGTIIELVRILGVAYKLIEWDSDCGGVLVALSHLGWI